jgi:hypothetical protein
VFFREDGLVIEWYVPVLLCLLFFESLIRRSKISVWNDTLLPERQSQSTTSPEKHPDNASSANINAETLKRKRDVIEIIDVDTLPTEDPPSKKTRPAPVPTQSHPVPSPKKGKGLKPANTAKHWAAGLSKEEIRKLGRGVEAASLKQHPPPPSLTTAAAVVPPNSCDAKHEGASAFVVPSETPISPPPKRLALPTRLTPSERKIISASYSARTSSSPGRDKKAMCQAAGNIRSSGLPETANSNSSQDTIPKPPLHNDGGASRQSTATVSGSTKEGNTLAGIGKPMEAPLDSSASVVGAPLKGSEERHIGNTLRHETVPQPSRTVESQVTIKTEEASLSEAESQEIERLCSEVDLPEYEMAEDFLRRQVTRYARAGVSM